jgi:hypothetical protein
VAALHVRVTHFFTKPHLTNIKALDSQSELDARTGSNQNPSCDKEEGSSCMEKKRIKHLSRSKDLLGSRSS